MKKKLQSDPQPPVEQWLLEYEDDNDKSAAKVTYRTFLIKSDNLTFLFLLKCDKVTADRPSYFVLVYKRMRLVFAFEDIVHNIYTVIVVVAPVIYIWPLSPSLGT